MLTISVYFIFNMFLFILSAYLFYRTSPDLMKKKQYVIFKIFIGVFEFYLIANTLWTMQEFDILNMSKGLFKFICFLSFTGVLANLYCFYKFSMTYYGYSGKEKPIYEFFGLLPFLITVIITFVSIWTGWLFYISEDLNIIHGKLYIVLSICAFIYFAIIFVFSFIEMVKSKSPQARRNCITILITVVALLLWVVVDDHFDQVTIIPIAIFSVILVLFTTFQQSSINTDALTQMNNRRKTIEFFSSRLENVSKEAPIYLYMCDVNYFKKINDEYGHLEGDQALVIISDVLKKNINKLGGFAGRYGGDEFILGIRPPQGEEFDANAIIKNINDELKYKCEYHKKPYVLSITFGYVCCFDPKKTFETYVKEADIELYEAKGNR